METARDGADKQRETRKSERDCRGSEGKTEVRSQNHQTLTSIKEKEKSTRDLGKTVSSLCWLENKFQWVGEETGI